MTLKIVWDEPKRLANLAKHGLDFATLNESFFETALLRPSRANRWMATGLNVHGVVAVLFAALGEEALSLISMRPASKRERKLYDEHQEQEKQRLHREGS
jgi:uncharacterized DUF497 family protein